MKKNLNFNFRIFSASLCLPSRNIHSSFDPSCGCLETKELPYTDRAKQCLHSMQFLQNCFSEWSRWTKWMNAWANHIHERRSQFPYQHFVVVGRMYMCTGCCCKGFGWESPIHRLPCHKLDFLDCRCPKHESCWCLLVWLSVRSNSQIIAQDHRESYESCGPGHLVYSIKWARLVGKHLPSRKKKHRKKM